MKVVHSRGPSSSSSYIYIYIKLITRYGICAKIFYVDRLLLLLLLFRKKKGNPITIYDMDLR